MIGFILTPELPTEPGFYWAARGDKFEIVEIAWHQPIRHSEPHLSVVALEYFERGDLHRMDVKRESPYALKMYAKDNNITGWAGPIPKPVPQIINMVPPAN